MNAVLPFIDTVADAESAERNVREAIESARSAQQIWAQLPVPRRLQVIRRARSIFADKASSLAEAANEFRQRPLAEVLTAEVLPLVDACRFLERRGARILRWRRVGWRGRPLWLSGLRSEIRREPHGVVLVIGPGNYPLFLPAVQALQAIVAGNAVLLKPGDGGSPAARALVEILGRAGLPDNLLQILPEDPTAAEAAISCGVDKVFVTGSANTGEAVLALCAKAIIPATVELSGCDAVFVRADADLDLVVRALGFGLRLNDGATCIAPRRVIVHRSLVADLEARLRAASFDRSYLVNPLLLRCVTDALVGGADLITGSIQADGRLLAPLILRSIKPSMRIALEDIFAPVLSIIEVNDDREALAFAARCPYSLGATIFSRDESEAQALAQQVRAGVVVVNDLIVPTADPRLPFGGSGRSGFGRTRGAEGLLEMTAPKAISIRSGKLRPHFDESQPGDSKIFCAYLCAAHGSGLRNRFAAVMQLFQSIRKRKRNE